MFIKLTTKESLEYMKPRMQHRELDIPKISLTQTKPLLISRDTLLCCCPQTNKPELSAKPSDDDGGSRIVFSSIHYFCCGNFPSKCCSYKERECCNSMKAE
ncbi:hypothetical protein VNO77_42936 [Canavalia gladiata]|uniref:Uncharacterized protein n=1 Tax=Canavalia gladiata TaxID=3824 RepID=A0AAN9JTW8_CANGL